MAPWSRTQRGAIAADHALCGSLRSYVAVAPRGYAETLPEGGVRLSLAAVAGGDWSGQPAQWPPAIAEFTNVIVLLHTGYSWPAKTWAAVWLCDLPWTVRSNLPGLLPCSGDFRNGNAPSVRCGTSGFPVLLLTGLRSRRLPPPEACLVVKLLHRAGIDVVLRQYSTDGDQAHQAMLRDLNRWMMGEVTGHKAFLEHSTYKDTRPEVLPLHRQRVFRSGRGICVQTELRGCTQSRGYFSPSKKSWQDALFKKRYSAAPRTRQWNGLFTKENDSYWLPVTGLTAASREAVCRKERSMHRRIFTALLAGFLVCYCRLEDSRSPLWPE